MAKIGNNMPEHGRLVEALELIERLNEDKRKIGEKIKEVYAGFEADPIVVAGMPVSKASLKQIIRDRKADMDKTAQVRAETDRCYKALANTDFANTELGAWATAHQAALTSARNARAPKKARSDETVSLQ